MKFEVDKQTKKDLEIFDTVKGGKSVVSLFDHTQCVGGRQKLYSFLSAPLADIEEITKRKESIAFFQAHFPAGMEVDKDSLDFAEYYIRHSSLSSRRISRFVAMEKKLFSKLSQNNEYYLTETGVIATFKLVKTIHAFFLSLQDRLKDEKPPKHLQENNEKLKEIFSQPEYIDILKKDKLKAHDITDLDHVFRNTNRDDTLFLLELIYEYDAFQAIAQTAQMYNFSYPEIVPSSENCLEIESIFHPFVENAIANDISFDRSANLLFISGPNMAGKSTFLKALGIAVYLAHAGFPVPAKSMKISVLSGLSTTINISDNLSSGYSHFYAEVMRIKDVARKLETNNNMMVLFDELFRGTNVKDAYDGTLAIVSAFARVRTSFFIISTHIVEVAEELKTGESIQFSYFDIQQQDGHPAYTYKLKKGVSDVRLGMYIIRKEGLIDLINNIKH
ncbi:hypothetical protein [Dysgonomonas sp. 511]|uniref:MutS-related protein n=1 Tax=Dysgonomonas sp. 511 TaxID=2302930 RepID=UPI0013D29991|nr:hypothetical protein [Dysgonomonas sp. 511]NDV77775.1 hypothetical protein [Dysgonomonas sp. 511]